MNRTYLYQINVTRECNLRCTHCYIHSDTKSASKMMSVPDFDGIINGIVTHMREIGYERAEIHVIGGEPTMLGLGFFEEVIPRAHALLTASGIQYDLILVSNLLSPDIVPIARLFSRVSTSYEPVTRFPKPKLEAMWRESVQALHADGINLTVTTAMTKPVLEYGAANLLEYLSAIGLKQVHLGFFIPEGDGLVNKLMVFPAFHETSAFLIDAANWYLERRMSDPDLFVNPVESMIAAIEADEPWDDIVCPIISGSMDINWDGHAATCLEAGGSKDPEWLGNVFAQGISGVAYSDTFMSKVRAASRPQKACAGCSEYRVCKSGCGVLFQHWNPGIDQDCPGFKRFIEFLRSKFAEGVRTKYHGSEATQAMVG